MRERKRAARMLLCSLLAGCRPAAPDAVTATVPITEDGSELQVFLPTRLTRIGWNTIATGWTSR